jgi:hypothetical protein
MSSHKQIDANRENAQKSTGPATSPPPAAKETLAEFNKVEQEHHDAQQEHLQAAAETTQPSQS